MRIKKKTLKILGFIVVIVTVIIVIFSVSLFYNSTIYKAEKDSFSYSTNRGKPEFQMKLRSHNNTFDVYDVNFQSRKFLEYPTTIYGILLMPKGKNLPGVVLLPGGGITKEAELKHAIIIVNMGYAVLTIDQRGIGQTGGPYPSYEDDYKVFSEGKEPVQHLSVYDALRAFDVLREVEQVDKNKIALVGLSMGGRYAIIAAAMDKRIRGVVAISSAGFHVRNDNQPQTGYFLSIDPDRYISKISPNTLVMIHGNNDSKVALSDAQITYSIAKEPKRFYIADGCGHGYCEAMHDNLKEALQEILS